MIYLLRPQASDGAVALAEKLTQMGHPAMKVRELTPIRHQRLRSGASRLVSWGGYAPGHEGLNNKPLSNKLQDAIKLREAGVKTIETALTRPMTVAAPNFFNPATLPPIAPQGLSPDGAREVIRRLQEWLDQPLPVSGADPQWVGRLNNHVGGNDLFRWLDAQEQGYGINVDYWVKLLDIREEYRVHSFKGASIRAGVKIPRAGATPHGWIRSWDGGWMISYQGVRQAVRDIAHAAIAALDLDFGAVDIGKLADNSYMVLEVNRAPGLEGHTIDAYANALTGTPATPQQS